MSICMFSHQIVVFHMFFENAPDIQATCIIINQNDAEIRGKGLGNIVKSGV